MGAQALEALLRATQFVELREGNRAIGDAIVERRDEQDAVRLVDRQAAKLVRVDQREEHVVHAEADTEHDDRGQREPAIAHQDAEREPNILEQRLDHRQTPLVTMTHA